jgi:DNA-directed RNA polymerase subunit M/transcription elongation factor TFIIS
MRALRWWREIPRPRSELLLPHGVGNVSSFGMKSLDQQEQWHRLTNTYRQMSEDELSLVADDAFDLVPLAREVLQAVLSERGLKIRLVVTPPPPQPAGSSDGNGLIDDPEDSEDPDYRLVCVRAVHSESEAKQLKALLDAYFIASCLGPENIVDVQDFKGNFDGGVEVKVHAFNSHRAFDVLARYAPEKEEEDPDEDAEYAVMCPKCHSQEITLNNSAPNAVSQSAETKFNWICDACGHEWTDEGTAQKI